MNRYEHVQQIAPLLPRGVTAFALNPDYWDPRCHICPHDAWVDNLIIRENLRPEDRPFPLWLQSREVHFELRLLGWSHKNLLQYYYKQVTRYSIAMEGLSKWGNTAHGDWLEDSFDVGHSGGVVHRIKFQSGAKWQIECADIVLCDIPI